MPRPISGARFGRRLRAQLGLLGSDPITTLDDVLLAIMNVEPSMLDRPELGYPAEFLCWAAQATIAAGGAGLRTCYGLFNPVGSGALAVVEYVSGSGALEQLRLMPSSTGFTDVNQAYPRDSRISRTGFTPPAVNLSGGPIHTFTRNNVALQAGEDIVLFLTDLGIWPVRIVLSPGNGVMITASADNQALSTVSFGWRWRPAEDGELR